MAPDPATDWAEARGTVGDAAAGLGLPRRALSLSACQPVEALPGDAVSPFFSFCFFLALEAPVVAANLGRPSGAPRRGRENGGCSPGGGGGSRARGVASGGHAHPAPLFGRETFLSPPPRPSAQLFSSPPLPPTRKCPDCQLRAPHTWARFLLCGAPERRPLPLPHLPRPGDPRPPARDVTGLHTHSLICTPTGACRGGGGAGLGLRGGFALFAPRTNEG